ncbi:helix-turn-helix transcriptional regulator, partial [Cribrihabitans sp. XS_ASV171]
MGTIDTGKSHSNRRVGDAMDIRWFRRRIGWTQLDLAERLGVDQGTISRWERGVEAPR